MIELEILDSNCNNCKFMQRDLIRKEQALKIVEQNELNQFNKNVRKLRNQAYLALNMDCNYDAYRQLIKEAEKPFVFSRKTYTINYGNCLKFDKAVSFIPNHCQLETQSCFEHRKIEL